MVEVALLASLALAICLVDPRKGIFLSILAGFLADPIRKMLPGEPLFLNVVVVAFVAATFMADRKQGLRLGTLGVQSRNMQLAIKMFLALVVVQSGIAFLSTGSPVIAAIGLLAYFAPLPAIFVAYHFARNESDVFRLISFYILCSAVLVSGVYLSVMGYEGNLLRAVGVEQIIYSAATGERLQLLSGFLRSSENAAWHASTAACLLILLAVSARRSARFYWIAGIGMPFLIVAILLTGRRKGLVAVVLFLVIYAFLLAYFRRGAQRLAVLLLLLGVAAALFAQTNWFSEEKVSVYRPYVERGSTAAGSDAIERLRGMTIDSFKWIIAQNGLFGAGAGTGSQGAQYFGGGADIVGGAAEGGLGKVLAELGVPGLALLFWLLAGLLRVLWQLARDVNNRSSVRARMVFGLLALLGANAVEFTTAHQIYGDPFVLLMLGSILGFALAIAQIDQRTTSKDGLCGSAWVSDGRVRTHRKIGAATVGT
ncbi:MAG TPA: O-antigen ligase family protein [Acidobacteriota bacterium]|jgi:hypothetical protein